MRLLVVEDDDRIADFLVRALTAEGHNCVRLDSGNTTVSVVQNGDFELIILDLMLPGLSGLDVCQELRIRNIDTPIIMLTAMDGVEDVVRGLKMGADDYMTKPFDIDELFARMDAVCRRKKSDITESSQVLQIGNVVLNCDSKTVKVGNDYVALTAKELSILELLMANPDKLFSRERVLNNIWGVNVDPLTNVVDVYVGRIRKKLGEDNSNFIETVRGMGYRINTQLGADSASR